MKTPSFWYRKPGPKAMLLSPFGQVYRSAGLLRRAVAKPYKSKLPVICVGNIVAGGAGKTPTCIALARLAIKLGRKPVFVTRGYGGTEKGPIKIDLSRHTAQDVGDEALLLAQVAPCWVGRSRPAALQEAEKDGDLIIMDDGLQNPKVAPDVNLLVVDGAVGFGNRHLIPAGPLRETLNDAFSRITAIIMIGKDAQNVAACLGKPVLTAHLRPTITSDLISRPDILAFAGIGRPQKFYDSCREAGLKIVETQDFPDHHLFSSDDLAKLAQRAENKNLRLMTTAKDWVRLPDPFRQSVSVLNVSLVFEEERAITDMLIQK